jgi:hypothetical protein
VNIVVLMLECPAADRSCLAIEMFCVRCGTVVSVEGYLGPNGESLATLPKPLSSAATMPVRSSDNATACLTRASLNGGWSLRIGSSRWLADLSLMIL